MATGVSQVSAVIADTTRERLERFARQHGVKKSHLIETAILHHLAALEESPADLVVPRVIDLSCAVGEDVVRRIERAEPPTPAMKALFDGD
jgi:predicted DNA-binding protein